MLIKLSNDDLPLKLGRKVETNPQPAPAKNAKPVKPPMRWVPDDRTPLSDFDHPVAEMPDPVAVVAAEYEKMYERFPLIAVDPGRVGGDMTAAVRYSFKNGTVDVESIEEREIYEPFPFDGAQTALQVLQAQDARRMRLREELCGITDIMRGVADWRQQEKICPDCGVGRGSIHHPQCKGRFR